MSEKPTHIEILEKEIITVQNRVKRIEERFSKVVSYFALMLIVGVIDLNKMDSFKKELGEISDLARTRDLSIIEMVLDLQKKGTLPPALNEFVRQIENILK